MNEENKLWNRLYNPSNLFILASFVLIFGLLYSRALMSIGMMLILLSALITKSSFKTKILNLIKNKAFLFNTLVYFIFLISILWTDNLDYFQNRMNIKLPFLILPFAFINAPKLSKRNYIIILYFFVLITFIGVLWSVAMFLTNYSQYIEIYSKGQILPTPIQHIRFSMMVCFSIAILSYFRIQKWGLSNKWDGILQTTTIVALIIYLHVLAVRTGLLMLYVFIVILLIYKILTEKKYKLSLFAMLSFMVLSIFAYQYIPTIKKKINYTRYSIDLFQQNKNIHNLSDSRRLGSIKAGLYITQNNPVLGCGIGDIKDATNQYLSEYYPEIKNLDLLPHNQYIFTSASLGLVGLILYLILSFTPLLYLSAYKDLLISSFHFMFFASFLVEHTIEAQIGTALFLFLTLLSLKYYHDNNPKYA